MLKKTYIIFGNKTKNVSLNIQIKNNPIQKQNETKFLGVVLSSNLKWTLHIKVVIGKISKSVGIIAKVRHLIPQSLTRMLYLTLVEPYLNYCNIIWASSKETTELLKILRIQKKYCRLITFSCYQAHTEELFKNLQFLNIFKIYKLQLACHMFKIRNNLTSDIYNFSVNEDFHTYQTRHKDDIHKDFCRTKCRQDTVRFQGPKLWNSLPTEIKDVSSLNLFKKKIKQYLLQDSK